MVGKPLGLRWRMILIIVVLPVMVLMPVFILMGTWYRDSYRDARLSKGEMITRQIDQAVRSVEPYVSSIHDVPGLESYLRESIEGQPEIAFATLVLDNGFIVYHSLPELGETFSEDLAHFPAGGGTLQRDVQPYGDVYLILRSFPQPGYADRVMYAVVGEYVEMVEPHWFGWLPVALGALLALLLVTAMQFFAQRVILTPLKKLSEGAALIGAGDFTHRIESRAADEMGSLAHSFNEMGQRLQTMVGTLEGQVAERTAALERKTAQLEAVAVVSREAVSTNNVATLLSTAVHAISRQFGYYHVGMFLIDDSGDWAVLRATSSEGGAQMMARRHRLRVGHQGIVGSVAALGKPRIALDVGDDAVWFDNPELPKTRSEMALPLIDMDEKIVGVLDVQSDEPAAFTSEDIETLQLLSDQLSVVLRNAKLMEETQGALAELETLQREYSHEGWARVSTSMRPTAYEYDRVNTQAVLPIPVPPELLDGTVSHKVVMDGGEPVMLEPMRYRDQVVGVVALSDPNRSWTDDEVALVQNVTDQVAIALDNARLFEEAQYNARQQALLNFVLQTAATTMDPDQALHEIAQVLAQGLGMAVGIFTYPHVDADEVRLQALIAPNGESLSPGGNLHALPADLNLFFRGLTEPELAKMVPIPEYAELSQRYDLERVLYVAIRTATAMTGFIAMAQEAGNIFLGPETRALARNIASQVSVVLENMNLFEESQRRSEEMQSLYEISLQFSGQLEPVAVRQTIVNESAELFNTDSSVFLVYDPREGVLRFSEVVGNLEQYKDLTLQPGQGVAGIALQDGHPFRVDNYATWEDRLDTVARWDIRAALAVPLIAAQGTLGVLLLTRKPGKPAFEDSDVRVAELFATQATVALENARLYQESAKRARDLQQLYEAGLNLVSLLDVEKVLHSSADWALKIFSGHLAVIAFWDERNATYRLGEVSRSRSDEKHIASLRTNFKMLADRVRESGQQLLVEDGRLEAHVPQALVKAGILSQAAVPLRLGTQNIGVVFVASKEVHAFTRDDLQLLEFLGSQTASALQNAQLFGQVQSTLTVVENQARYQSGVAQASSLLVDEGMRSLHSVLHLLGEAAEADRSYYAEATEGLQGDGLWSVKSEWSADDVPLFDANSPRENLPPTFFPEGWMSLFREKGIVQMMQSKASPAEQPFFELLGAQSLLALAVSGEGHLPGILGFVDCKTEREWGKDELTALQTIAASLASTLARESLLDRVQEALADTEILLEAGTALNMAQSYDHILEVLLNYTILGHDAMLAAAQIFDHPWTEENPAEWWSTVAYWGETPGLAMDFRYPLNAFPSIRSLLSSDLLGVVADLSTDPRVDASLRDLLCNRLGGRGGMFVPLLVGGQWIGFVGVLYPQPISFPEKELRRVMSITAQAAVAFQNRYQLDVTASRARREQMIREIANQIQAAPDVEGVLKVATRELGQALKTSRTFLHLGGFEQGKPRKPDTGPLPAAGPVLTTPSEKK